jgi:hypothetical protein
MADGTVAFRAARGMPPHVRVPGDHTHEIAVAVEAIVLRNLAV